MWALYLREIVETYHVLFIIYIDWDTEMHEWSRITREHDEHAI